MDGKTFELRYRDFLDKEALQLSLLSNSLKQIDWHRVAAALNDEEVMKAILFVLGKKVIENSLTPLISLDTLTAEQRCLLACARSKGSLEIVEALVKEITQKTSPNQN